MIGRTNINKWIELIKKKDDLLVSRLKSIYGEDNTLIDERLDAFLKVATKFRDIYGSDREVNLVRVPARLNILGMHVDHRGGFVNPIAIDREIVLCYVCRNDDLIETHNMDTSYSKRQFDITSELPKNKINTVKDWLAWTQDETNKRKKNGTDKDWVNKLKSVPVYLQILYPDKKLSGFEGVLDSNIPAGVGLSSSSAIVVAMMEVMIDINHISVTDDQFVNYCGIAEWFVGTRGGSGDHAAIKFSRLGMITHMKTLPRLMIKSYLLFPEGYKILIFNSGIIADKSGGALQKFNEKTATYEIGEIYMREYLKKHHGDIFDKVTRSRNYLSAGEKKFYLADVGENFSQAQIYELLQSLPEHIGRDGLLAQLPQHEHLLREQFATHLEPEEGYQIRGVMVYGIAESERSRMAKEGLEKSKIRLFGNLMNISHDGDRVVFKSEDIKKRKRTIDTAKDLCLSPGEYDCSIPEIDEMVDAAQEAGACGAQISGAGLGGSIMVLVEEEKINYILDALRARYYIPRKIKEDFIIASPIHGACQL